MRIGLNLLFRAPGAIGGVETYVRRLVDEIVRLDTHNEYVLFVGNTADELTSNGCAVRVRCDLASHSRGLRYWWEQTVLPFQVKAHDIQLLHSLNYVGPVFCPCKSLVTFQDLSY